MLSLRDTASMEGALRSTIDPTLKDLIALRMDQLRRNYDGDLEDIVRFLIVEAGDSLREINAALGFPILENLVDGATFGNTDFTPSWEWIACHGGWFELVYVLSDDGYGVVVFIQNDPGIEFDVHALCLEYASACCADGARSSDA